MPWEDKFATEGGSENLLWFRSLPHQWSFLGPSDLKHISISPLMLRTNCCILHLVTLSLESPLDCNEIKAVNPKGNQSWTFIGRTNAEAKAPIFLLPDAKSQLIGKDSDAGQDCGQEKGTTEDEMVGWHHRLNGHEFEQAQGDSGGQGSLELCSSWGRKE